MATSTYTPRRLPAPSRMFRAFVERDSAFEAVFVTGVRSTGIFCRSTCPARKPRRENVEFFADSQAALLAGYRPCKRCRPLAEKPCAPPLVERLRTLVESARDGRISEKQLLRLGIDPSTARRQFRKHVGMTFQAYQRAHRVGGALKFVRGGRPVIEAQLRSGYESDSGFRSAVERLFGEAPAKAAAHELMLARWIETPLGPMLLVADDAGLRLAEFVDRRGMEREILDLRQRLARVIVPGVNEHLRKAEKQLGEYFAGKRKHFELALAPVGSDFELKVWSALGRIAPGTTKSYAEIAKEVGRAGAQRAVGTANGRNRLAVVIPCHRVIRSDGALSGYGGGVWRKQWLLDHEQRFTGLRFD